MNIKEISNFNLNFTLSKKLKNNTIFFNFVPTNNNKLLLKSLSVSSSIGTNEIEYYSKLAFYCEDRDSIIELLNDLEKYRVHNSMTDMLEGFPVLNKQDVDQICDVYEKIIASSDFLLGNEKENETPEIVNFDDVLSFLIKNRNKIGREYALVMHDSFNFTLLKRTDEKSDEDGNWPLNYYDGEILWEYKNGFKTDLNYFLVDLNVNNIRFIVR
jgi:hypothetical protein